MKKFSELSRNELLELRAQLVSSYEEYIDKNLSLNMARGKPSVRQTELSYALLNNLDENTDFRIDNMDARNYGIFDGISSMKKFFAKLLDVPPEYVFVGGNSSLSLMFDTITRFYTHGVAGCNAWCKEEKIKFLCPVPGYDRHFAISEYYGFEMIAIEMDSNGPDMAKVRYFAENDPSVKGIWCVPKYSNPSGITYSDEVVKAFSKLRPAATDFRIFWDNAYCVHSLQEDEGSLLSIMSECKKQGNEDLPILFTSTSKITFPGAGVAAIAASEANMKAIKENYKYKIISFDKLNQLRHSLFFEENDINLHMKKHAEILKPKFDIVLKTLDRELSAMDIASWNKAKGGYFISVDVFPKTAKTVVALCEKAGLILTSAGATYPQGLDPQDKNIRIAPSFPECDELQTAMDLFCLCVKLAAVDKLLKNL